VETEYQRDTLRDLGCVYGQGFLFGHPQPVSPLALQSSDDDAAA
jgi:EAL domain-containing protein (putative c-di-GMP-specific phosphodiesterase class I)